MKKIFLGISLAALVIFSFALATSRTFADDKPKHDRDDSHRNGGVFNPDKELSRKACGDKLGNPLVDVTQKVQDDTDSGVGSNVYFPSAGNYWNVEGYTRHIKAWQTASASADVPATFCAIVTYENGHFDTFYKQTGPAGTGFIGADVNGEMSGGYRATFTGTFAPTGAWVTNGNVGTFDYNCDLAGNCGPGRVDWIAQYFPGYGGFDQPWWGWKYQAGSHGTWINASTGSSGNIL